MNKILIFLLGAAIGGVGTYFVVKRKNDIEWDRFLADLEDEKKHQKDISEAEKKLEQGSKAWEDFAAQVKKNREEEGIEELSAEELKDYYIAQLRDLGYGVVDEDYDEVNPVEGPEDDGAFVYGIEKILYDTGRSEYSKEHLAYYKGDDTFVDLDTGEPIDNWGQYLGDAWYREYETATDDTVYIRNEQLECDFEVIIKETSFAGATGESHDDDDYVAGDFADKRR